MVPIITGLTTLSLKKDHTLKMENAMNKRYPTIILAWFLINLMALSACTRTTTPTPTPTGVLGDPVTALPSIDLYVSTSGNDDNDCQSETTACLTIAAAMRKSTPWSTIHIGAGEFHNHYMLQPPHSLNFYGAGRDLTVLISDHAADNIMVTGPYHVYISDLTIGLTQDNDTFGSGLDVRNSGARVTLENSLIRESYAGLRINQGQVTVRNCIIEQNGYGIQNSANLTLIDSTVRMNASSFGTGFFNDGEAHLENTDFLNNGATVTGGGATSSAIVNGGQLTITGGRIANNGDGIINQGGNITLGGVTIEDNNRTGVWHMQGTTEINTSLIRNSGAYGVNVGGRTVPSIGTVHISQSALLDNGTAGLRIDGGEVHVQNSTISGNIASSSGGGGIWQYSGSLILLDSTVAFNTGYGLQVNISGTTPTITTIRRSVIALNSGDECYLDPRASVSLGTPPTYTCNDSWTQTALGLDDLTEEAGTFVHPLQSGSPLIDAAGPPSGCPANDQRGLARPAGTTCDIGAYESGASGMAIVAATPGTGTPEIAQIYTETPTPQPMTLTFTKNAFCRKGPGTAYFDTTAFEAGKTVSPEGHNDFEPLWWYVLIPNSQEHCWVSDSTVDPSGSPDQLPVQPAPPLPETPNSFVIAKRNCTANGFNLLLGWEASNGASGYHIFLNGQLIETASANQTAFQQTPPMGKSLKYTLEAINQYGASEQLTVEDSGCNP